MRALMVYSLFLIIVFSCQEDIDCNITYLNQTDQSIIASPVELQKALTKTSSPYTDASFTFSSHCYEEIEELAEWLQHPPGYVLDSRGEENLWYLDGAQAFIPADTAHLKWWLENLMHYGEITDCKLEGWSLGDIYDYSPYPSQYLDTIKAIAHHNRLSSGVVGIAGKRPQQFDRRYWLLKRLTIEELLSLIDFPNPVIKAVAFEGLYLHKYPNLFQVLLQFLTFKEDYIHYTSGCLGNRLHLSQYCFSYIMRYYPNNAPPEPPNTYEYDALTVSEQEIILKELEQYGPYW